MHSKRQLALLVVTIVGGLGVAASAQKAAKPKGFFIEPKNGGIVTSPVHTKSGANGIEIAAGPAGDLKKARAGVGHYHIGVGVICLPPGRTIVKGTPSWVHFG